MNADETLHLFILESRELLENLENALLALDNEWFDSEQVNAIFRAAHTIKGSAGLFGLDRIVAFTHVLEHVLDEVRNGKLPICRELTQLLLACGDHISDLVDATEAGTLASDDELHSKGLPLLAQLHALLANDMPGPAISAPQIEAAPVRRATDIWHISLRFGRDAFRNGMDPLSFIRYLDRLGTVVGIETLPDAMPAEEEMDAESCYLGFEIALRSDADKQSIEAVFDFVREDCAIRILAPESRIDDFIAHIASLPEEAPRLGEILVRCGSVTAEEVEAALRAQSSAREAGLPAHQLGEQLVAQGRVHPAVVDAALQRQQQAREAKNSDNHSVRVDADKLDHLINLVGELIIATASTDLEARRAGQAKLQERTSNLSNLVEAIRDGALKLRMVKIGASFRRFQRVVHDVSQELGKDIELQLAGEDTELDKTLVEKIADPLTHLVRNAMDHGIEPVEQRLAQGKPARGCVRLNAFHESGSIVIEVSDDGGGLRRERILAKAVERGLVPPGATLTDSETFALIFEPGFSTAEQVTNLSGRGVGMDVVKRNITALRGHISIDSREGEGTTVSIRLPLTLAIIDGFLVSVGGSAFVLPLDMVDECIDYSAEPEQDYTNLRGTVLPFIRLRDRFEIAGLPPDKQNIVIVKHAGQRVGLVVDALLGEFQTVIKPLGKLFKHIKCLSGSTILGNGEVALILDVPTLVQKPTAPPDTRQPRLTENRSSLPSPRGTTNADP